MIYLIIGPAELFGDLHPRILRRLDLAPPTAAFELFPDAIPPLPRSKTW